MYQGITLATVIVASLSLLWVHSPWWIKKLTLVSVFLTDIGASFFIGGTVTNISGSITGITAGLFAGLILSLLLGKMESKLKTITEAEYQSALVKGSWIAKLVNYLQKSLIK